MYALKKLSVVYINKKKNFRLLRGTISGAAAVLATLVNRLAALCVCDNKMRAELSSLGLVAGWNGNKVNKLR